MVLHTRINDNSFEVVLTDGKTGFIQKEDVHFSKPEYVVPGNSGVINKIITLKKHPNDNSEDI